jgi:hypothetical protein
MKSNALLRCGLALAVALGVSGCSEQDQEKYVATLSGANEVPAVSTSASGRVVLIVAADGQSAEYSVEASGLGSGVTGGHFHRGAAGLNGPVILSFYSTNGVAAGSTDLEREGRIARVINKTQLDTILTDLRAGNLYANIHTSLRPGGEIRGQMTRQ